MLEIKNLSKTYRSKKGVLVKALDDVSLKLPQTGMVFILGKSGSGKSTLLNVLAGLDSFDSGEMLLHNKSMKDFSQNEIDSYRNTFVGFVFQEYNILEQFSVKDNISLSLDLQGKIATDEEINNILKQVNLEDKLHRKPNELSGGEKQRVAIARALIKNPQIIMADEPTGALDSKTGNQVLSLLKELSKSRLVLVVTHDNDFAQNFGDRIIEIKNGKITSDKICIKDKINLEKETINEPIKELVFKDNLITKPENYKLTSQDILKIQKYKIENNYSEVNIIEQQNGNFENTDQSKINIETFDNKFIKSKLSFKKSFKMACSATFHKFYKLILTIILCVCAFGFFGVIDSLTFYNKYNVAYNTIVKDDRQFFMFTANNNNFSVEDKETITNIVKEDTKMIFKSIGNLSYHTSFTGYIYPPQFFPTSFKGTIEINESEIEKFGYSLCAGVMPDNTKKEVLITKYVFETFKARGFYYKDENAQKKLLSINDYSDILGQNLSYSTYKGTDDFKIVGILDTNVNLEKFSSLMSLDLGTYEFFTDEQKKLFKEYNKISSNPINTMIFLAEGFIQTYKDPTNTSLSRYGVLGVMPKDNKTRYELVKYYFGLDKTSNIEFEHSEINEILMIDEMVTYFKKTLIIFSLIFGLFGIALLANFISMSIQRKQKEIGILRAVGARKMDIFKIFVLESSIIGVIDIILANIVTYFSCYLINESMKKEYKTLANTLDFGPRQSFFVTLLIIVSVVLTTLYITNKYISKSPIDAIEKR